MNGLRVLSLLVLVAAVGCGEGRNIDNGDAGNDVDSALPGDYVPHVNVHQCLDPDFEYAVPDEIDDVLREVEGLSSWDSPYQYPCTREEDGYGGTPWYCTVNKPDHFYHYCAPPSMTHPQTGEVFTAREKCVWRIKAQLIDSVCKLESVCVPLDRLDEVELPEGWKFSYDMLPPTAPCSEPPESD